MQSTNTPISRRTNVSLLVTAAVCLALCMVLPFLTGQIPSIGSALSPMHIPVLLCGFLCGPAYAAVIGAIAPALRFMLFGMPPLFPVGVAMSFELAAYGLISGLLYGKLPRRTSSVYIALVTAMVAGRVVWGVAQAILLGATGKAFTWAMFIAGALTNAIPGIVVHIVLIPLLVLALERAVPAFRR
jgi:hypothetical protein